MMRDLHYLSIYMRPGITMATWIISRTLIRASSHTVRINEVWRVHFIAASLLKPDEYGWHPLDGSYAINWYSSQQLQQTLFDILLSNEENPVSDIDEDSTTEYESDDSDDGDDDKGF